MTRVPRIGLNLSLEQMDHPLTAAIFCRLRYVDAVAEAGALPVPVPPLADERLLDAALEGLDGFCFIGGDDYHPDSYGGRPQPATELMHERRHRFDLALARRLLPGRLPLLGVCGGHQLINIALGGALIQDIPTQWRERPPLQHAVTTRCETLDHDTYRHEVRVAPGSRLARIVGAERVTVNSFHHQAIDPRRVGRGLVPTAWAEDGVIEAAELPGERFVLGVQWHPERLVGDATSQAIFAALAEASMGTAL